MLKGTEVVEKVQVWVINTQLNTVFVRQLEMGESELKGVGPRNTGDGVEEGMWMAGILSLLVRSEELDNGEREEISELTVILSSVLYRKGDGHHLQPPGASVAGGRAE